jgi:hypothetical protein
VRARITSLLLPLVLTVTAQDVPESRKSTPQEKAAELLQGAADMVSTASPPIQVAALMEMAKLYTDIDRAKSVELFEQAFSAAGAIPPSRASMSGGLQQRVVMAAAEVDPEQAAKMLDGLPIDQRSGAIQQIVRALVRQKKLDRAVEVLEQHTGSGAYPFDAAEILLARLPADDGRRVTIFGTATAGLDTTKEMREYGWLLAKHWQTLPPPTVQAGLTKMLNGVLDRRDGDEPWSMTISGSRGSASFDNRKDAELFDILWIVQAVDPKKAKELLEKRPALAQMVTQYPEGRKALIATEDEGFSTDVNTGGKGDQRDTAEEARMRLRALSESKGLEAQALASKDIQSAVSRAREIPDPLVRGRTLVAIASTAAEKDPATARSILGQVITQASELKDPQVSVGAWILIADAANRAKAMDLVQQSIDRGLADCAALYKLDTDADDPNRAAREVWPSTQQYRSLIYRAGQAWGVDAEALLSKIQDPDLQLMARIELARSLLGKPRGGTSISISRGKRR